MKRFVLMLLLASSIASAVTVRPSLLGGLIIPAGEYSDDETGADIGQTDAGFAGIGAGGLFRLTVDLNVVGLGIVADAGMLGNSIDDDDLERQIRARFPFPQDFVIDIDAGWWLNFPIMSGVNFRLDLTRDISWYAMTLAGVNILWNTGVVAKSSLGSAEYKFDPSASFALAVETGFSFSGFTIASRMLYAGQHEIDVEETVTITTANLRSTTYYEKDNPVLLFSILLGSEF